MWRKALQTKLDQFGADTPMVRDGAGKLSMWVSKEFKLWEGAALKTPYICCLVEVPWNEVDGIRYEQDARVAQRTWGQHCDSFQAYTGKEATKGRMGASGPIDEAMPAWMHAVLPHTGAGERPAPNTLKGKETALTMLTRLGAMLKHASERKWLWKKGGEGEWGDTGKCEWFYTGPPTSYFIAANARKALVGSPWWRDRKPKQESFLIGRMFKGDGGVDFVSDSSGMLWSWKAAQLIGAKLSGFNEAKGHAFPVALAVQVKAIGITTVHAKDESSPGELFEHAHLDDVNLDDMCQYIVTIPILNAQDMLQLHTSSLSAAHVDTDRAASVVKCTTVNTSMMPFGRQVLHKHVAFKHSFPSEGFIANVDTGESDQFNSDHGDTGPSLTFNKSCGGSFRAWSAFRMKIIPGAGSNIRIVCVVFSISTRHDRLRALHKAWGHRCSRFIAFTNASTPAEGLTEPWMTLYPEFSYRPGDYGYNNHVQKTRVILKYVVDNHLEEMDYLVHADDDTFMVLENLRLFLRGLEGVVPRESKPLYLGHVLEDSDSARTKFNSGGAGFVLNRAALRKYMKTYNKKECGTNTQSYKNDVILSKCLKLSEIMPFETTRDERGAERFQVTNPAATVAKSGFKRLSVESISFHYLDAVWQERFSRVLYSDDADLSAQTLEV
jgi:hypothetical protein